MADDVVKFIGVKETLKTLRSVEPELYKQFRKDIRDIANPGVVAIKSAAPAISPFAGRTKDGMSHNGRTAYKGVQVSIAITPAQRSRAFGSTTSNLVAIKSTGRAGSAGFNIVDMAGRGSNGRTRSGRALIQNLNGRPSRFVYPALESKLPEIRRQVAESIDKAAALINRKLDRF